MRDAIYLNDGVLGELVVVDEVVELRGEHGEAVAVVAVTQQQPKPGHGVIVFRSSNKTET